MIKIEIDLTGVLPTKVTRTLDEGQELCPTCSGVGLVRKSDERGDYITICTYCYGRTYVNKCLYCGEVERGLSAHRCDGLSAKRKEEFERREQDKWDNAEKISYAEACKRYEQVVVGLDTFLPIEDVLDQIASDWQEGGDIHIPRVWGTYSRSFVIEADDVLGGLEDLHDNAEVCDQDYKDLNNFLQTWCKRSSVVNGTKTYYPDERVAIVVTEKDILEG